MRNLTDCRLYGILDLGYVPLEQAMWTARQMIEGDGVDILQLRAKNLPSGAIRKLGRALHTMTAHAGVPLIINDYPEVASSIDAEGAHIGQDDGAIDTARAKAGKAAWVGRSTHSVEQAVSAGQEGADYIGFGPLFATPTKPDYTPIGIEDIRRVHEKVPVPIFCIGGIKLKNLQEVIAAGAQRVVIVSGILQASNISEYIAACHKLLKINQR